MPWLLLVLVWWRSATPASSPGRSTAGCWRWSTRGEASEQGRRELEIRLQALATEKAELAAARDNLQKSVEAKSSELAELKGTFENLQEKMKEEIAKGEIALSQAGGRLQVDMVDKILFDSGSANVSKRGDSVLARVGGVLAQIGDKQLQVSGHTDNQPISRKLRRQFPTNWELSIGRAMNVVRFLQDQAGVPPERLVASGYGEHHPIDSNRTQRRPLAQPAHRDPADPRPGPPAPLGRAAERRRRAVQAVLTQSQHARRRASSSGRCRPRGGRRPGPGRSRPWRSARASAGSLR